MATAEPVDEAPATKEPIDEARKRVLLGLESYQGVINERDEALKRVMELEEDKTKSDAVMAELRGQMDQLMKQRDIFAEQAAALRAVLGAVQTSLNDALLKNQH